MRKKNKNGISKAIVLFMVIAALIMSVLDMKTVEAATKYVSSVGWDTPKKVGKAIFVAKQQKVGSRYMSKIVMKKDGKRKTLVSEVEAAFVTNGSILYYSKPTEQIDEYRWNNTIYSYNIKSGKSTKIISGENYTVSGCSGKYLYCGTDNWADGVDLYAVNIKSKKKKHMTDIVGSVVVSSKKVLTTTNSGDAGNYPIYTFDLDGSGKKKIANGGYATIKNGKIYYAKYNEKNYKVKIYRCSLNGKNKKAVTKWCDKIPSKYL